MTVGFTLLVYIILSFKMVFPLSLSLAIAVYIMSFIMATDHWLRVSKLMFSANYLGHQVLVRFTPAVYKYLLQMKCTLDDLKIEDHSLHG